MHDLKPLILPNIVAARKSSKSSLDMSAEPTSSVYSSADSGFCSTASDCSTPPTPNYHSRGHFRYPSSTSSLSSSPPSYDFVDAPNASGKLPKLAEEPVEREDDYVTIDTYRCSCEHDLTGHEPHCVKVTQAYSFAEEYLSSNDSGLHLTKRRRSMESSSGSITNKLERRFPSFSRKVRERKRASTWSKPSRSTTPSRTPLTPSSSVTSIHQAHSFDLTDSYTQGAPSARASEEHLSDNIASSPITIDVDKANAFVVDPEEVENERFATTPLLPPMLISRLDDLPASSPLQSPTVADASQSLVPTPFGTPPVRAYPTPPLSSKPSVASFKTASRPGHMVPSSDIPPMMLADPNDKWANALGHANFTILPEPYIPDVCDAASLRQLFNDWEQARCNYAKHQVRTAEHYGVTSKHFQLTEQKWQEIDSMWKKNNDLAISRAAALGAEPEAASPVEPAPLSKMPSLNDPKSEGKFPKLGDEDIVGPMVQIASQIQKTPTRKRAFFRFLNDLRFPGSFLGRSSTGVRGC